MYTFSSLSFSLAGRGSNHARRNRSPSAATTQPLPLPTLCADTASSPYRPSSPTTVALFHHHCHDANKINSNAPTASSSDSNTSDLESTLRLTNAQHACIAALGVLLQSLHEYELTTNERIEQWRQVIDTTSDDINATSYVNVLLEIQQTVVSASNSHIHELLMNGWTAQLGWSQLQYKLAYRRFQRLRQTFHEERHCIEVEMEARQNMTMPSTQPAPTSRLALIRLPKRSTTSTNIPVPGTTSRQLSMGTYKAQTEDIEHARTRQLVLAEEYCTIQRCWLLLAALKPPSVGAAAALPPQHPNNTTVEL